MQTMLNNPQFLQQMSRMMSDPAIVEQLIAMDPQMQAFAPQMRQMFQNPQFREMMYVVPKPYLTPLIRPPPSKTAQTHNASNKCSNYHP